MAPGTVRNHQPWTPGMLGTGPGSVNTSARVKVRAARKSACLFVLRPCAMHTPIVVQASRRGRVFCPRLNARLEGSLDAAGVSVLRPAPDHGIGLRIRR